MLQVYSAQDQKFLDKFISNSMNIMPGWAFAQVDREAALFPAKFVVIKEPNIKLATIEILQAA